MKPGLFNPKNANKLSIWTSIAVIAWALILITIHFIQRFIATLKLSN